MKKKVAIIVDSSKSTAAYRIRRFQEEALKRTDVDVQVVDVAGLEYAIGKTGPTLLIDGVIIEAKVDAVYCATLVGRKGIFAENVFIDNGAQSVYSRPDRYRRFVRGKMQALTKLAAGNIPVPPTFYLSSASSIDTCLDFLEHRFPVVIKPDDGPSSCGKGVMIVDSEESFRSVAEYNLTMRSKLIVQQFMKEARGVDYRVIVAGNTVLGAMKRDNSGKDFRSNVYQGGVATPVQLEPEIEQLAIRAIHARDFEFGGVDIILTAEGPMVLEVNTPCNFEAFEKAHGLNVASAIIDLLASKI